jgi:hypothetical protein
MVDWQMGDGSTASELQVTPAGIRHGSELALKLLTGLKSYRLPRGDISHFSRSRIAADASLTGFNNENAEATEFYALAALKRRFHRFEQRLDRDFSFDLGNARLVCYLIDYIELDHFALRL